GSSIRKRRPARYTRLFCPARDRSPPLFSLRRSREDRTNSLRSESVQRKSHYRPSELDAILSLNLGGRVFLKVVTVTLDFIEIVTQEAKHDAGTFERVRRMDVPGQVGHHHSGCQAIDAFLLQSCNA